MLLIHGVFMCLLVNALRLNISVLVRTTEGTKLCVLMTLMYNLYMHKCILKNITLTALRIQFSCVVDYSSEYTCLGLPQVQTCTE